MTETDSIRTDARAASITLGPVYLIAAIVIVIGFAFFNGIENLFKRWGEQQELSHGYFLPLIAAWIIWDRRKAVLASVDQPATIGLVGVLISATLLVLSEMTVTSLMIFEHLAMILLFGSLALALGGRNTFWLTLLPVAFLLFMVPPPYWVITQLSQQFQLWSSQLGVFMIERFGIPVFLSGNIIDLGDYQLQVAEACSGLRYLFPFLSLGFLAAYLYQAPLWQRVTVFLSTIPITIVMNSFRIALTGVLVQQYGVAHAEGIVHLFEGWVVFLLCLVLLFGVIAGLAWVSGNRDVFNLLALPEVEEKPAAKPWKQAAFTRHAVVSLVVLIIAGLFVHFGTSNILRVPDRVDLAALPGKFEGWKSEMQEVDKATLEVLGADDFVITNLTSPEGNLFNLYIAYLNAQRHGHSWHSPQQCIPGGGWQITDHKILPTETTDGKKFYFNRLIIENRGHTQLLYYWYDQRSRKIANEYIMKIMLIFDAVKLRRTDGAMIRIMTPLVRGESIEEADARLSGFMRQLEPKLPDHIPGAEVTATTIFDPDS